MILGYIIGVVLGTLSTFLIMNGRLKEKDNLIKKMNTTINLLKIDERCANITKAEYRKRWKCLLYGIYYNPETDTILTLDKLENIGDL